MQSNAESQQAENINLFGSLEPNAVEFSKNCNSDANFFCSMHKAVSIVEEMNTKQFPLLFVLKWEKAKAPKAEFATLLCNILYWEGLQNFVEILANTVHLHT